MKLKKFLKKKNYIGVKLKRTNTNHYLIKTRINGIKGRFILDTGASNTCVGSAFLEKFNMNTEASDTVATGAGTASIETAISNANTITIGHLVLEETIIVIDLAHINKALKKHKIKTIHGIIGADILLKNKGIIDYKKNALYLKE